MIPLVLRTLAFAVVGALPGLCMWAYMGASNGQAVVIMCLGAFVVGALSHPKVSAANVVAGTVGAFAADILPASLRGSVIEDAILSTATTDGHPPHPEQILGVILEYSGEHGIAELAPQAQQVALVSWAEGAADTGSLNEFLEDLAESEIGLLRSAYADLEADDIAQAFDRYLADGNASDLQSLIENRMGYDLDSLCGLLEAQPD